MKLILFLILGALVSGAPVTLAQAADILVFDPPVILHEGDTSDPRVAGLVRSLHALHNPPRYPTYEDWLSYMSVQEPLLTSKAIYEGFPLVPGGPTWSLLYALELDHPNGRYLLISAVNEARDEIPPTEDDLSGALGSLWTFKWEDNRWKATSRPEQLENDIVVRYLSRDRSEIDQWIAEGRVVPVEQLSRVESLTQPEVQSATKSNRGVTTSPQELAATRAASGASAPAPAASEITERPADADQQAAEAPSRVWLGLLAVIAAVAALTALLRKSKRA